MEPELQADVSAIILTFHTQKPKQNTENLLSKYQVHRSYKKKETKFRFH